MDPNSGKLYESFAAAQAAGVKNPVELIGAREDVERVSEAVKARNRAKRKAQKKARRANR